MIVLACKRRCKYHPRSGRRNANRCAVLLQGLTNVEEILQAQPRPFRKQTARFAVLALLWGRASKLHGWHSQKVGRGNIMFNRRRECRNAKPIIKHAGCDVEMPVCRLRIREYPITSFHWVFANMTLSVYTGAVESYGEPFCQIS